MKKFKNVLYCGATNSTQSAIKKPMQPEGIVIHSSGINAPYLKTYVQPSKSSLSYLKMIKLLGKNNIHNDGNHTRRFYNYHFWIGKLADGTVATVMTHPLDIEVGMDKRIHICLCEDNLQNGQYEKECVKQLCEILAQICDEFNGDSSKIVDHSEIKPSHKDASYGINDFDDTIESIRKTVDKMRPQQ